MYLNTEKLVTKKQSTVKGKNAGLTVAKAQGTLLLLVICSCIPWMDAKHCLLFLLDLPPEWLYPCVTQLPSLDQEKLRDICNEFHCYPNGAHMTTTLHTPHVKDIAFACSIHKDLESFLASRVSLSCGSSFRCLAIKRFCPSVPNPRQEASTWIWGGIYLTEVWVSERSRHPFNGDKYLHWVHHPYLSCTDELSFWWGLDSPLTIKENWTNSFLYLWDSHMKVKWILLTIK